MKVTLSRLFPFLSWKSPSRETFKADAWAGISVGLVLIPQAIAYASLAGMPPETGLYAALLPAVIGALWGSCQLLAVGPVALTSLLVYGSLIDLAEPGSAKWVSLAVWLAFYSGLIQLALGVCRFGRVTELVSQPVVHGFVNAAALIIIVSQFPDLVGIDKAQLVGALDNRFWLTDSFLPGAFVPATFGFASIVLLIGLKRLVPRFPSLPFVCVCGILASWWFGYETLGGEIVGFLPTGLPGIGLPSSISFSEHRALWPAALTIAFVSFTEAMSSCRTLSRSQQTSWDENQELVGQGLAKISSGLCGAFPVSGSFSRSALVLYAGARSAWSSLFSTACVVLSLIFLMDVFYFLPKSVLAAMIMVPTLSLINFRIFYKLYKISRHEAIVAMLTFAATLLSVPNLYWGICIGVVAAMTTFLYRRFHPRIIEVSVHPDGTLRDRARFDLPAITPDLLAVRMDSALNFLTCRPLERYIVDKCSDDQCIKRVLISANGINDIDSSGIEALETLRESLMAMRIELYISAVKMQVMNMLDSAGAVQSIGERMVFATDLQAVTTLRGIENL